MQRRRPEEMCLSQQVIGYSYYTITPRRVVVAYLEPSFWWDKAVRILVVDEQTKCEISILCSSYSLTTVCDRKARS